MPACIGAGYQIAVSPEKPACRNNVIMTTRLTF
jgi:hypothetical protein